MIIADKMFFPELVDVYEGTGTFDALIDYTAINRTGIYRNDLSRGFKRKREGISNWITDTIICRSNSPY
jgi:hypothetical protein